MKTGFKRIIAILMVLVMGVSILLLPSCGNDKNESTSSSADSTTDTSTDTDTDIETDPNTKECKHESTTWITDTPSTCTEEGSKHEECDECHETIATQVIEKKQHTESDWIVDLDADCLSTGIKHKECTECGEMLKAEKIDIAQHEPGTWVIDIHPTCEKEGSMHKECITCGEVVATEKILTTDHVQDSFMVTTPASCLDDGTMTSRCKYCGKVMETKTIPAAGHTLGAFVETEPAGCLTDGAMISRCTVCNEIAETKTIPSRGGHDIVKGTCQYCGERYIKNSKDNVLDTWRGKTLNILATRWNSDVPRAPWSVAELCVTTTRDDDTGYGRNINNSILDRAEFIKNTYGVTLNWVSAPQSVANLLNSYSPMGTYFHIAMPRMYEAQTLVMNSSVLDMAKSEYIDFGQSYFNQMAHEAYTISEHTFFAAGDFSFTDEQTSFILFYSKTLASQYNSFPDIYNMVRNGEWTIDKMYLLAASVSENLDGNAAWTDEDKYGFGTTTFQMFFQYFGIQQVSVDPDTQQYYISLNNNKVDSVIDKIIYCMQATWARSNWGGNGGRGEIPAFVENRLLFLNQALQTIDLLKVRVNDNFQFGLLPFPKLTESDEYHTPVSYQSVVICIPKCAYYADGGKDMAEYFVDVLSWTGQEFLMYAYLGEIMISLSDEDSVEMLKDYILPNRMYDQGYLYSWNGLLTSVQIESYKSGRNRFMENYMREMYLAQSTINDWNNAWTYYYEDD